jgi:hypothetical protein
VPFREYFCISSTKIEKILKKIAEKFGDIKIMPTFAIPFEKRGSHQRRNSTTSSLKRLIYYTRSK